MTRFPLQTVLDLMQSRADGAARELGKRIAAEKNAKAQLAMLEEYRSDYAERFRGAAQRGMSPREWQNYQEFMARLDEAIDQQTIAVTGSERHRAAGQQQWMDQANRLRAFDHLADRHHDRERQIEGRREQKLTDEIASRHSGEPKVD